MSFDKGSTVFIEAFYAGLAYEKFKSPDYWIGGRKNESGDHWQWNDGVNITYTDWASGMECNKC